MIRANLEELRWLGLEWDEGPSVGGPHAPYLQSQRHGVYREVLEQLESRNHLFKCYLSRKDLRETAAAPHGQMLVYGKREREQNERVRAQKLRDGKSPSLRFRVEQAEVTFNDLLQGEQSQSIGDFIVKRSDGEWAYQLAVVADDIAMGITEVVRGDDLLQSTAAQLLLYRALGAKPPTFLHVPLLLDGTGERMAKRKGSLTLTSLKEGGAQPQRVVGLLAHTLGLIPEPAALSVEQGLELYSKDLLKTSPAPLGEPLQNWLFEKI